MRFIHCADVHLGCLQLKSQVRYNDFFAAFEDVATQAISSAVDALLVAGDLFHHRSIEPTTLQGAIGVLKLLKDNKIPVIVTEGNHDKAYYVQKKSWLEFLHSQGYITLLNDGQSVVIGDCKIVGMGYLGFGSKEKLEGFSNNLQIDDNVSTILMVHAGVNRLLIDPACVPISSLDGLIGKVNYVALGHIHSKYSYNDWIFNPGSLENVHINEANQQKGYYLAEVTKKSTKAAHYKSIARQVLEVQINGNIDDDLQQYKDIIPQCILRLFVGENQDVQAITEHVINTYNPTCLEVLGKAEQIAQMQTVSTQDIEQNALLKMAQEAGFANYEHATNLLLQLKNELLQDANHDQLCDKLIKEAKGEQLCKF